MKSRLHIKYLEGGIKTKRTRHSQYYLKKRSAYRQTISGSRRGTWKKSLTGLKTNQAGGRDERSAGPLLSGGQGQCGNVLYVNTDVSQTRWPMALPKCFHPLESGASATTNKQTNTQVRSPTGSRDDSGAKKRDDRLLVAVRGFLPPPPSADPRIRICGWWGTGGEGRVFLPGLAGGQACVR